MGRSRPTGRNSAQSPLTWRDMAAFRTRRICGRLSSLSSGNPEKSRRFADPPFGGYCGQGEAIETNPAMSAGIQRKRHLFGATGRNFVPPGSAARFGRSSGNPENVGGPRIRCPACSAAKAGDSGNPHLVGRYSAHSPLTWRDRAEFRTTRTSGRLSRMSSRNPEKSRRFLDQPSDGR